MLRLDAMISFACMQAMMDACDSTQLTFLGTGCAEPSKYRGSSAIHLCLKNGRGLLLDAGEGAFGQMVRCYGASEARKQVRPAEQFPSILAFTSTVDLAVYD